MSKTITPMHRVKDNMDIIKSEVNKFNQFKIYDLNKKSGGKFYQEYLGFNTIEDLKTTKGINSDYILIFELKEDTNIKSKQKYQSFAFSFHKIKEDIEDVLVTTSIKNKNKIVSQTYHFNFFKIKLKEFKDIVKQIDQNEIEQRPGIIFSLFKEIFEPYAYTKKDDKKWKQHIKYKYEDVLKDIVTEKNNVDNLKLLFENENETVGKILTSTTEYKEISELEDQIKNLKKKLKEKKENYSKIVEAKSIIKNNLFKKYQKDKNTIDIKIDYFKKEIYKDFEVKPFLSESIKKEILEYFFNKIH